MGLIDAFDRADEIPLSLAGQWGNWAGSAITDLASNRLKIKDANNNSTQTLYIDDKTYPADNSVWCEVGFANGIGAGTKDQVILYGRQNNTPGTWNGQPRLVITYKSDTTVDVAIEKVNAGPSVVSLTSQADVAHTDGDYWKLEYIGTALKAYKSSDGGMTWTQVLSTTDATGPSGAAPNNRVGVQLFRGSATRTGVSYVDNFGEGVKFVPKILVY